MDIKKRLHFNYWLMKASERLLEEAIPEATGALQDYYKKHLEEERRHEEWLAEDLKRMGVPLVLDLNAASVAGAQYYLIKHVHPALLLGYMWILEAAPKPLETVEALEQEHGPLKCLRYHAEHDPDHVKDLADQINALPEDLIAQVISNATWVANSINSFLGE